MIYEGQIGLPAATRVLLKYWTDICSLHFAIIEVSYSAAPITTRGADYAHHNTTSQPGFENPAASLIQGVPSIGTHFRF